MTSHSSKRLALTLRSVVFSLLVVSAFSSFFPTAAQTQPVVPFYRFARPGPPYVNTNYFFYSTNPDEAAQIGFFFNRLAGYIYTTQVSGTVPLYRMYVTTPFYAGAPNRYLYATDTNPVTAYGYVYDGIAGYVYPGDATQFPYGGPFFIRFYSQDRGPFPNRPFRHFFTASGTESLSVRAPNPDNDDRPDWVFDAIGGYLASPIEEARFFVRQQYFDVLGRGPEQSGWDAWTNYILQCGIDLACRDSHRKTTARGFLDSMEFKNAHPILANFGTPEYNREYVRQCYLVFLRREPDQGGWDNWTNYINGSGDYDTLVGGFINSIEYYGRFRDYDRTFYSFTP